MEKMIFLFWVFDICVDEKSVGFRMNILHHDLETIKAPCLGDLDFAHKIYSQVLINDTITGGKESQYVRNEMPFSVIQVCPILKIPGEIDLFSSPETGFMLLVHFPDSRVIDGQDHEAILVFS